MDPSIETRTVTCHVYQSEYHDNFQNGAGPQLHLWALTRESKPVRIICKEPPIFCHIELPRAIGGTLAQWNDSLVASLLEQFKKEYGYQAPVHGSLVFQKKAYFYRGNAKTAMIQAVFRSTSAMYGFGKKVKETKMYEGFGMMAFNLLGEGIGVRRKIFTLRRTRYAQWFTVTGEDIDLNHPDRVSTPGAPGFPITEIIAPFDAINPIPLSDSSGWITRPRTLSFDIETRTDNYFSMPDRYNPQHVAYMISCIYQQVGLPETRQRYVILLGDCNPIEDTTIIKVQTELELVQRFTDLVNTLDPEILTGYNIFGYDFPYLDVRIGNKGQFWPSCSRTVGQISKLHTHTWKSSGAGFNSINYLMMDGRISIDMLLIVRRDYKFEKYTLDVVAKELLGASKHDVTPQQMFQTFDEMKRAQGHGDPIDLARAKEKMTAVTRYCIQDAELVTRLMDKMNVWIGLVELSSILGVEIMDIFTKGQQARCLSAVYDLCTQWGIALDKRTSTKMPYKGGYVGDPIVGLHDNIICLDFASLYPSIMRAYNICYTTLVPPELDMEITDDMCYVIEFEQEEGVRPPAEDDLDKPEWLSEDDEDEKEGEHPAFGKKVRIIKYRFRFVKEQYCVGVLPTLVGNLVSERTAVKAQMEEIKAEIKILEKSGENPSRLADLKLMLIVLDKRQNGIKVSANSMYGFLGVQDGGVMPLIEGAMSITAMGRYLINMANDYVKKTYPGSDIVYNDTDSLMIKMPETIVNSRAQAIEWGTRLSGEISALFKHPLKLEFEKAMRILCIKKKKYAYIPIDPETGEFTRTKTGEEKIEKRGIVLARRDNFPFLREAYTRLLLSILRLESVEIGFKHVIWACSQILGNRLVPKGNLTIIRSIGDNYKGDYFMKVFGEELAAMGRPANSGDRLEYVVVKTHREFAGEVLPLGKKMRTIEMYQESLQFPPGTPLPPGVYPREPIDSMYYIDHLLKNSIDQLFSIGYDNVLKGMEQIGFTPQNSRAHFQSVKAPVAMISKIATDFEKGGQPLEHLVSYLDQHMNTWFQEWHQYITTGVI